MHRDGDGLSGRGAQSYSKPAIRSENSTNDWDVTGPINHGVRIWVTKNIKSTGHVSTQSRCCAIDYSRRLNPLDHGAKPA